MDGRPITADTQHPYPPQLWTRSTSSPAVPRLSTVGASPTTPVNQENSLSPFPATQVELLPFLFPQQSSLYQAQLLQYNKLIAPGRGGGLQSQPLPPLLSAQNVHVGSRSRSASKASNHNAHSQASGPSSHSSNTKPGGSGGGSSAKDSRAPKGPQSCHGNRGSHTPTVTTSSSTSTGNKGDRSVITSKDTPSKMPAKKPEVTTGNPLPPRQRQLSTSPTATLGLGAAHSNSVPSTPHQHARDFSFESRDQSPNAHQSHSPRSAYSESNGSLPSLRPLPPRHGGCRYETGLKHSRRRMAYNIGSDPLERSDLKTVKNKLSEDEERKLTTDMRELYDRLQPTDAVEEKRGRLVAKLEGFFNEKWPGHDIHVQLFGSSGNLLCSDDSDVDICIVTSWKDLEDVCKIADLLAKKGMEKVVCVSSAKVPIVKAWDPELQLACDMNVNNTLALENTRMIRTYVDVDERVRPLAMIIKHWTRRRIVNDAAYGGTLSSYTWICMIIAFLQLRQPPILPVLHQRSPKPPKQDGEMAAFADDIDNLRGFGANNKATLGELLFQFFRFYAHEFDYSVNALSIRLGKVVPKKEKNWHFALNNQLCVEEPFNTNRNLGNTADDTAFRGLQLELRRAFDLISQGDLDGCCEQYVFPKEEERIFQKPPPVSRPVLLRSASQQQPRGGRNGGRGGRHTNQYRNNGNHNNRRASSSIAFDNPNQMYLPPNYVMPGMNPQDMYMQPSAEALAHTLNALQLQENNLRFLQYTQSQAYAQQQAIQAHAQRMQSSAGQPQSQNQAQQQATERSRTNSLSNSYDAPPLTAPLRTDMRQDMYYFPMGFPQAAYYTQQGFTTYPSSPSNQQGADFRRNSHRSSNAGDPSHSALRSQSQPASRTPTGTTAPQGFPPTGANPSPSVPTSSRHVNGVPIPSFIPDETHDAELESAANKSPPAEKKQQTASAQVTSPPRRQEGTNGVMPAFGDIGPQRPAQPSRRLSAEHFPREVVMERIRRASRSPSPADRNRRRTSVSGSTPLANVSLPPEASPVEPPRQSAPLVVNGSSASRPTNTPVFRHPWNSVAATPEAINIDNPLNNVQFPALPDNMVISPTRQPPEQMSDLSPTADRPIVANGSSPSSAVPPAPPVHQYPPEFFMQQPLVNNGQPAQIPQPGAQPAPILGSSPSAIQRMALRHASSPLIAQLDLATGDKMQNNDFQHLSPVYEANSPSPIFTRKLEFPLNPAGTSVTPLGGSPKIAQEAFQGKNKSPTEKSPGGSDSAAQHSQVHGLVRDNGHIRGAKSESDNGASGAWQKIKGKKKGNDSRFRHEVFPQSEPAPSNEAERKGG